MAFTWDEPAGCRTPRGWLSREGVCVGFYIDYGHDYPRSTHKYCQPFNLCRECQPGSILALRYPGGPGTKPQHSRWFETVEAAREFVRSVAELNEIMSFGRLIHVTGNGTIETEDVRTGVAFRTPDEAIYVGVDENGSILGEYQQAMIDDLAEQGWTFLDGYSSQDRYSGPVMHACESIGGRMETDILTTPGFYVAFSVETEDDDEEPAGWAVLYRES